MSNINLPIFSIIRSIEGVICLLKMYPRCKISSPVLQIAKFLTVSNRLISSTLEAIKYLKKETNWLEKSPIVISNSAIFVYIIIFHDSTVVAAKHYLHNYSLQFSLLSTPVLSFGFIIIWAFIRFLGNEVSTFSSYILLLLIIVFKRNRFSICVNILFVQYYWTIQE